MTSTRVDIEDILGDPEKRRDLCAKTIIALQAREGIVTTLEQAYAAYDEVQRERSG